jgi:glycerol-3-phosphate acyltransferase PlsX
VVVTDGFVGNILLKFAESVGPLLETKLRHQINTNVFSRFGALLMKPFLRRLRNSLDYAEYGGAPLLGIDGVVIICHGKSGAKAIMNAIFEAEKSVRHKVNLHIKEHLKTVQDVEPTHAV